MAKRPQHRGRVVLPRRDVVDDPLAPRGPAVPARHRRLGVALVEEDEPVRVDLPHPLAPLLPLGDEFGVELLLGPHRLFFRVMSDRSIARQMVIRHPWNPVDWRNSWSVASGFSRMAARSA